MQPELPDDAALRSQRQLDGQPTVFLESTVIAQGLPWPENFETAIEMEAVIEKAGAVPATIGILDGTIRIGLSRQQLEWMAKSASDRGTVGDARTSGQESDMAGPVTKANRRDLSIVLSRRGNAATTVSATLWLARQYVRGPCVMATGGLGGVHRGAAETFDISTDLDELARADGCAVVCSGFKSILDLPATLEVLETKGVPIVGYRTDELPAFTSRSSGLKIEHRIDSPERAAELIYKHRRIGLSGALVIANPVSYRDAISQELAESSLDQALEEARRLQIGGKAITPFLLDSIRRSTDGASLRANRSLLVANAELAAQIAVALDTCSPGSPHRLP